MPIRGERCAAIEHDVEDVDERLDVVDDRRLAEEARLHRERRLVPRLAAEALDRIEQRGFLATNVGAGAAAQLDVEADRLAHHPIAKKAGRARLRQCAEQSRGGERILAANIDVALLATGREPSDGHRLDDRERVLFHQHAIFERAGLRFVGVADHVVRPRGGLRDRLPLASGRESARRRDRPGASR